MVSAEACHGDEKKSIMRNVRVRDISEACGTPHSYPATDVLVTTTTQHPHDHMAF